MFLTQCTVAALEGSSNRQKKVIEDLKKERDFCQESLNELQVQWSSKTDECTSLNDELMDAVATAKLSDEEAQKMNAMVLHLRSKVKFFFLINFFQCLILLFDCV
jgi:hypothetical protein